MDRQTGRQTDRHAADRQTEIDRQTNMQTTRQRLQTDADRGTDNRITAYRQTATSRQAASPKNRKAGRSIYV